VGLCPFHSEKSPSFGVSADKQLFHCFGCGAGGDLFAYVMRIEGLDFPSAVRHLAAAAGVELPEDRPADPAAARREAERERAYSVNAVAQEAFRAALSRDAPALRYLTEERGLSPDTVERFEIGWAPDAWSYVTDALAKERLPIEPAVEIGLLGRRARDGKPYDRLRGRVTFPIRVPGGRVAGFGARRADWIDPEGPKYLNSPESPIYDKSRVLYGLPLARDDIRKKRQALLVEGYLDVIVLAQAGFTQTVAGCGTALTEAHARTLARLTHEVVTLYDGDLAGRKATHRAAILLLAAGVEVRVVPLPEGVDPDDLVRQSGAEALAERIESAPSAIDFFLQRARAAAAGGGVSGTRKCRGGSPADSGHTRPPSPRCRPRCLRARTRAGSEYPSAAFLAAAGSSPPRTRSQST
ncbi:MAG: DNA primase, partial [Myxococcota bacterium]